MNTIQAFETRDSLGFVEIAELLNHRTGAKLTVESSDKNFNEINGLEIPQGAWPKSTNLNDFKEALDRVLSGHSCMVAESSSGQTVLHLIDRELIRDRNYKLNQKVTLEFSGPISGITSKPRLIEILNQKGSNESKAVLILAVGGHSGEPFTGGGLTVSINVKDLPIREALTAGVATNQVTVLWRAITSTSPEGVQTTSLRFTPPPPAQKP